MRRAAAERARLGRGRTRRAGCRARSERMLSATHFRGAVSDEPQVGLSAVSERLVEVVSVKELPAAAVRRYASGGHEHAEGARGDARVGDGRFHGHPGGGCLGHDLVGEARGDASRYLVGQLVEVEFEPQRWPRRRTDRRRVGTLRRRTPGARRLYGAMAQTARDQARGTRSNSAQGVQGPRCRA